MHEQAHTKDSWASVDGFREWNKQGDRLSGTGDDDLLTFVYPLEQLRERAASVVRVVLSK